MKKKICVFLSQYFYPINVIGAKRSLSFANCLADEYDKVIVLCMSANNTHETYIDNKKIFLKKNIKLILVDSLLPGYGLAQKVKFIDKLIGLLFNYIFCSPGFEWMVPALSKLKKILQTSDVDKIVITGSPFIPFYFGSKLANLYGVECILDYRDLWTLNPRAKHNFFIKKFCARFFERPSISKTKVLTVSKGCKLVLENKLNAVDVKILRNFPSNKYITYFNKDKKLNDSKNIFYNHYLNLVIVGTVYKVCQLDPLLDAIKLLDKETQKKIRIHYFGLSNEVVSNKYADSKLVQETLIFHGFVTSRMSIEVMKKADVLVSLVFDSMSAELKLCYGEAEKGLMTTKIYDYLLSGRPIINIAPSDFNVVDLVTELKFKGFFNFDSREIKKLSNYIYSIVNNLAETRKTHYKVDIKKMSFENEFSSIWL